jgi:hypothetical protein
LAAAHVIERTQYLNNQQKEIKTMKRVILFSVLTFTGLGLVPGQAHATDKAAKKAEDWQVLAASAGTPVMPGTAYTMFNKTDKEAIKYGKRTWGVDLVWDKSKTLNNMKFMRKDGTGALKYGDTVAIYIDKGNYLSYQKMKFGVNLNYAKGPAYEWVILGGKKGEVVKTGQDISLFNQKENDFLIYAERPVGINLRWFKDRDRAGGLMEAVKGAARDLADQGFHELSNRLTNSLQQELGQTNQQQQGSKGKTKTMN